MPRSTKIVNLSLPLRIYQEVEALARLLEVSKSKLLRDALRQYVASERRWQRLRQWGDETAERLDIKDEDDVDRLIHEFREESSGCGE